MSRLFTTDYIATASRSIASCFNHGNYPLGSYGCEQPSSERLGVSDAFLRNRTRFDNFYDFRDKVLFLGLQNPRSQM